MTKRKKHSPEEIVRKLQTAERLAVEGANDDEIAKLKRLVANKELENLALKEITSGHGPNPQHPGQKTSM